MGGGEGLENLHMQTFFIYICDSTLQTFFCVTPSSCKHFKFLLACNLFQKFPPHPEWSVPNYMVIKQWLCVLLILISGQQITNQFELFFIRPAVTEVPTLNWCSKLTVKTDCKSNKRHDELTSSFSASRFHSRTTGWNLFRNKDEWRSFHQSKVLVFYH